MIWLCMDIPTGMSRSSKAVHKEVLYMPTYDKWGFDKDGFNRDGYNKMGYNREGYNKWGFDIHGFNRDGINQKTMRDRDGYDLEGS